MVNPLYGGYIETDREKDFPWTCNESKSVWYCVMSDDRMQSFAGSKSGKKELIIALKTMMGAMLNSD